LVTVGGVLQDISAYNINGFFIVFVAPPGNGVNIRVIHLGIRRDLTSLPNNSSINSPVIINGTISSLATAVTVPQGGTGATTLTSGGLLVGNGTSAVGIATAAQIVAAISTTAVTNATNATNVTGTTTASIPVTALGSGTADSTTFLRGDRTFQTIAAPVTSVVGQTGAVTNIQIRDALLSVDGAGSGLDADLLDGYHASNLPYVSKDMGVMAVGMTADIYHTSAGIASGATSSAASLQVVGFNANVGGYTSYQVPAGTWRNISNLSTLVGGEYFSRTFQRIA
jgi:hypothetical protein